MRLLIIHLSDMHIKTARDAVLKRAERIADAANSRSLHVDSKVLIFTGDIAYSGKADEYVAASLFLNQIRDKVDGNLVVAVSPGNHDCDFSVDLGARDHIIEGLQRRPDAVDPSVIEQCVVVQKNFFQFRDSNAHQHLRDRDPLCYAYRMPLGAEQLSIRCINTAWVSKLHEKPGSLVYPSSVLRKDETARFTISAFHHPYNWLTPASSKEFRRAVEHISDLVLTGHEHEHERHSAYRYATSKTTAYIEGCALADSSAADVSAFNLIVIDTKTEEQQFFHFEWKDDRYYPTSTNDDWEPIALPARKARGTFEVQASFREWLDDSGIPNLNKAGRKKPFSEIFLFPQLIESVRDVSLKQKRQTVKSADVFATLQQYPVVFISAPPKSGRTALAKRLFADYLDIDYVPLYIDAAEGGLRGGDALPAIIRRHVDKQYGADAVERYRQLRASHRVIIVDNIDKIKLRAESVIVFLSELAQYSGHVVVMGDDTAGRIKELAPTVAVGVNEGHRSFEIEPFNSALRERMAQQWFRLDGDAPIDEAERSQQLERATQTLDTIIGRNYVPAFPIYVIAVLQALGDGASVDMRASTHGYFYEILIRLALAARGSKVDFDVRLSFLTHLAAEMFENGQACFLRDELRASFDRFQQRYEVGGLDYRSLVDALVSLGMLLEDADQVRFRYPYLYYYFVANYLSRNITRDVVRRHIERLSGDLANEEAADVLVFLAHLSSDGFVIDKMLEAANSFYASVELATLDAPSPKASETDVKLTYVEKSTDEARQQWAERRDEGRESSERRAKELATLDEEPEARKARQTFSSALETIRIIGQLLKNFPGSLEADTKLALVEACYGLGLRCMTVALQHAGTDERDIIEAIVHALRKVYPNLPERRLEVRAKQFLWLITVLTSFGLIKVISNSIAAPELEPAYGRALVANDSAAKKLIEASLKLDISRVFPSGFLVRLVDDVKGKPLPTTLLKFLVFDHFQRFSVPRADRQKVCDKLGIEYKQLRLPSDNA